MKQQAVKHALAAFVLGSAVLGGGVARAGVAVEAVKPATRAAAAGEGADAGGGPAIQKKAKKGWGVAELGFQGSVIGGGSSVTFLGPVITLQGARYRPIAAVFQFGAGVGLYGETIPDPVDDDAFGTDMSGLVYVGMGIRIRPLQFGGAAKKPFDLFVGPLVMVFVSHDLVTVSGAGEVGAAYRFGRFRVSLALHGGYTHVMHQFPYIEDYEFDITFVVGGQLSFGLRF